MARTAVAVGAALVALAFACSTFERWLAVRRRHDLAWSGALGLFVLAAAALAMGAGLGWDGPTFRAFYLFGAILNVPFLALGTVYLVWGTRIGDRVTLVVSLAAMFAVGVVVTAPFTAPVPRDTLVQGSLVFGVLPRVLAAVGSGVGAVVIAGGAGWSVVRRQRVVANVLIAAGTLILGTSGLLNSVFDAMSGFAVTLLVGITVIFAGFLVATATPAGSSSSAVAGSADDAGPGELVPSNVRPLEGRTRAG